MTRILGCLFLLVVSSMVLAAHAENPPPGELFPNAKTEPNSTPKTTPAPSPNQGQPASPPSTPGEAHIRLIAAQYGVSGHMVDVTAPVAKRLAAAHTVAADSNQLGMEDPAPGIVKTLSLRMQLGNGEFLTLEVPDRRTIRCDCQPAEGRESKPVAIKGRTAKLISAIYGVDTRLIDVTNAAKDWQVGEKFGTSIVTKDPALGVVKTLTLKLMVGGQVVTVAVQDGGAIFLESKPTAATARAKNVVPISIDITVEAGTPSPATTAPAVPADLNVIERPEYRDQSKALVKSVTSVTAMQVIVSEDGDEMGLTGDVIAVVPAQSRRGTTAGIGFYRVDGDETMKTALEEAVRAVKLRYPIWEPGHIDLSFGEKFTKHGGPSAGTAFAVLMLSVLEGFDIDPKCAMTGDITVDWKVRKIGGTTAKIHGATLDKCVYAAIPEENALAMADMGVIYGNSALWNIQIFSIATLQDAVGIARKDRAPHLVEAMKLFAELQGQLAKAEKPTLQSAETRKTLAHVLELAPNHLSAKYLLDVCDSKASKTLSTAATLYRVSIILYPYEVALAQKKPLDRDLLPASLNAVTRKRIEALRPIANKELLPLVVDLAAFTECMDGVASKAIPFSTLEERARALDARFSALSADRSMVEKMVRDGY
jgi:hypothetical protein